MASELQAGPTVQMIFARRMVEVAGDASTGTLASCLEDLPDFKIGFRIAVVLVDFIIVYGGLTDSMGNPMIIGESGEPLRFGNITS